LNPIHKIVAAVPAPLRVKVRALLDAPARRAALKKFFSISLADTASPVIGLGGTLDHRGLIHGGAVKLLSLRDAFFCDEQEFNLLYLVSSAQPAFADDLVRICRARGIKFVWNQNGVGYPAWAGREAERHNAPMRRLRAQADHIVYQSAFCRESAEKFLGPCAKSPTILLNPVDLQKYSPRRHMLAPEPLRLLAMGTQNYRERFVSVLECLRELRADGLDCSLTVAGPLIWPEAERDAREIAASFGIADRVELRPPFRQDEAPDIYRAHHLLLHSKYMDPCPTVVAEALACGLPVVASRSGGIPEMVDTGCAELIDAPVSWETLHTPSGRRLAQAVQEISPRLGQYSRAARRRAEEAFDARRWQEHHAEIFRAVLAAS